jgi:hypothetical protein
MDMKGFGYSEGSRGVFESEEQILSDHLKFFDAVNDKFGGDNVQ